MYYTLSATCEKNGIKQNIVITWCNNENTYNVKDRHILNEVIERIRLAMDVSRHDIVVNNITQNMILQKTGVSYDISGDIYGEASYNIIKLPVTISAVFKRNPFPVYQDGFPNDTNDGYSVGEYFSTDLIENEDERSTDIAEINSLFFKLHTVIFGLTGLNYNEYASIGATGVTLTSISINIL